MPLTINTFGNAWEGAIAFDLSQTSTGEINALVVIDTNGNLLNVRQATTTYDGAMYNIAPNTLLFMGEPGTNLADTVWTECATHIWNLQTNLTEDFPNVISEHDIQYNPDNNTFLTLQDYVRQVGSDSILFDKILQVDAQGNVLWSWDTYDHIPLSEASPFNETVITKVTNRTVKDFTHANALDWDYNNGVIYLNVRNVNTFYKINQTTGDIIWACGEFGNFTLLDSTGNQVPNLWYHCHDTKRVAPNVFTMFDNDYENNTNPNDCHSALKEITLNETSMTAYIDWSWEAPTQYWTPYGGATVKLPNGDWLGCFGTPTHHYSENQPWNFNDTGAVFIEVNPKGEIVKTFTFPAGWYVYRVEALTNYTLPLPGISPTPALTDQPSTSPSVSPKSTQSNQPISPPMSSLVYVETAVVITLIAFGVLASVLMVKRYLKRRRLEDT
ncbi:MAG: aryl-sulfate sulfotransferase [Candidatus Bathyarchaeota archaeon]|nr:aryl-sulfate sulfotransferase [Candidatus Bathyarchaeota archaeon]